MPAFTSADPNAYIALGIQSALGSPQTTPAKHRFAKYLSGNRFDIQPAVVDLREGGDGLDFGSTYKSGQEITGQLVCYPRPDFLGQALALIPGGATWAGASAPAIHSFHTNHASHPYATLQIAHPGTDLIHLLSDVRFTGLTLEGRSGQPWMLTMPFQGIKAGASTGIALVPSYALGEEYFLYHGAPSYVIDGAGDSTIESISLSIALGVEPIQAQSIEKDDIVVQNRDINLSITRRYQNSTLWKKIVYGGGVGPTTSVATGSLQINSPILGAAADMRRFIVNAGALSYRSNVLSELNPDGQTIRETVSAKVLKTASAAVSMTLHNGHASVYGP